MNITQEFITRKAAMGLHAILGAVVELTNEFKGADCMGIDMAIPDEDISESDFSTRYIVPAIRKLGHELNAAGAKRISKATILEFGGGENYSVISDVYENICVTTALNAYTTNYEGIGPKNMVAIHFTITYFV